MFYDDVFKEITENSPFTEACTISLGDGSSFELKGFYCSGSYGEDDLSKGYTTKKTVNKQTFKVSLSSLPSGVKVSSLSRATLVIHDTTYTVREVSGNESGTLSLDLIKKVKNG